MKTKTSILTVSIAAIMAVSAANAELASTTYVDGKITPVETKIDNHVANTGIHVTAAEKSTWSGKQDALGFTPENTANKLATTGTSYDTTKVTNDYYPTAKTVEVMIDNSKDALTDEITGLGEAVAGKQNKIAAGTAGNVVTYSGTAGSVGSLGFDNAPTANSTNLVKSGAIKTAVDTAEQNAKDYAAGLAGNYATAAQGTKADNAVPNTRKVNGKALDADISLSAADVGADASGAAAAAQTAAVASAKSYTDTEVAKKVTANDAITGATHTKITYDSKGLVTAGADLTAADIPTLTLSKISDAGSLAGLDKVGSEQITDGSVALGDLATGVQTSLGKADSAVQPAAISDMETKTHASQTYQAKALVTSVGSTSDDTHYPSAKAVYTAVEAAKTAATAGAASATAAGVAKLYTSTGQNTDGSMTQKAVTDALGGKQATISDLATIRSNAEAGKGAADTIADYGDIVSHNASEFQAAGSYVPTSRKVNGKTLSSDITLSAADVGADASGAAAAVETKLGAGANGYDINAKSLKVNGTAVLTSHNPIDSALSSTSTNAVQNKVVNTALGGKQDTISDLATIRSNATAGKGAATTIATYGNIVTHNTSEFQVAGNYITVPAGTGTGKQVLTYDGDAGKYYWEAIGR